MEWTTETPARDGFYWVVDEDETDLAELIWHAGYRRFFFLKMGSTDFRETSQFSHFMGPLPSPELPITFESNDSRE